MATELAKRYRKKPVVIEAARVPTYPTGDRGGYNVTRFVEEGIAVAEWCGGASHLMRHDDEDPPPGIEITTREGVMRADPGDWIIKGGQGEFYPCKPDIFEATYEPADAPTERR